MNRWIGTWLRAWRSEPVVFESPLPVEAVRTRLIDGSTPYLQAFFSYSGQGGFGVFGRVGTRRISLQAVERGLRNSWRPVLRGRLEPVGTGSRFAGRLGWSPSITVFSGLWLGGVSCFFLFLAGRAAVLTWRGDATADAFLVCLAPLGMMLFFVGLSAWGIRAGRREERYLRSWMADRLQTAEAGIPGYRPWPGGQPVSHGGDVADGP